MAGEICPDGRFMIKFDYDIGVAYEAQRAYPTPFAMLAVRQDGRSTCGRLYTPFQLDNNKYI
jgi:hypothetical protein